MQKVLTPGRKQTASNEAFQRLWDNIEKVVSRDHIESLVADAVLTIRSKTANKKAGYAWSGGKDSIALQVVCELSGIRSCVIGLSQALEYPHYLSWIHLNKPAGLVTWDANIGYQWLLQNPHMVFPEDSKHLATWYSLIQHAAQKDFYKNASLDIICLGRRHQDGNYTGSGGQNIYTDKSGVTRFSPIAHWKHEHVLAVCHYYKNRNLPPIYDDPQGWINGTGVWPVQTSSLGREHSWELLYQISPETLHIAADYFNEAKSILQNHGKAS
jgi:hypothetical protein